MHFSENYQNLKDTINDVIFLAGATTINVFKFSEIVHNYIGGRFINCFNKNDAALFISQPFSDSPIGLRDIFDLHGSTLKIRRIMGEQIPFLNRFAGIENYETDLGHMDYCNNLEKILKKIKCLDEEGTKKISFI